MSSGSGESHSRGPSKRARITPLLSMYQVSGKSLVPYLSATTSASYRLTYWLESIDPTTHVQTNTALTRQLLDLRMNVVGPVLSRIFQPPENGYADRFKHLIEPSASIRWLSPFDQIDNVVKFDQVDYEVGGTTTLNYALTNRLLAKRKREGRPGDVRTILTVAISLLNVVASMPK